MRKLVFLFALVPFLFGGARLAAQEAAKPGPEHALLKKFEGTWEADVKCPMGDWKATAIWKPALGGLWTTGEFKGAMKGQEFVSLGMTGYDATKKKYVSHWFCSMCPSAMVFEGDASKDGTTLTLTGEGPGPDGKPAKFRNVTTFKGPDVIEEKMAVVGPDGKEAEMMSIVYKRKK